MFRYAALAALCCLLAPVAAHAQIAPMNSIDPIARFDFNGQGGGLSAENRALPGVRIETGRNGSPSLTVEQKEPKLTHVSFPLPIEKARGARITFTAMVKAENVAVAPQAYNGIKVMLVTVAPSGKQYLQQNSVWGTFDWKPITHTARVPADATEAYLILGLENTTGKAWFDDAVVTIAEQARKRPTVKPTGPVYKGHNLGRLRGAMVGRDMTEEDLRVLGREYGANLVRWQLDWWGPNKPGNSAGLPEYEIWLNGELDKLDRALPICEKYGLMVVIDIHTPPGGRDEKNVCRMFQDKTFQDYFPVMWERIARRYKGKKIVWGYDLVNEPVEGAIPEGMMNWNALALETAKRVQAIDPDHAIIVEPAPWASITSINELPILPLKNIVYSVHMYSPGEFTHQGVGDRKTGIAYPGEINGMMWDKDRLRKALQEVKDFQTDYGVHIYIGEFSAIRWAPGDSAYNYLKDVIDIFEENGWDWSYHAYREWDGWSLEHGSDPNDHERTKEPTSRLKLFQSWFAKNKKP